MISYKERLPAITTFIFDVDGVLTNGDIAISGDTVIRTLNSKDGYAMNYAVKKGYPILIITGGHNEDIKRSLETIGIKHIMLRSSNKMKIYDQLKTQLGFVDEEVLYMGDDIPDIPVMKTVGCSTCPQDASVDVKMISHYQSPFLGGRGCVRDVIEQVMRVQGTWLNDDAYVW